MFFVALFDLLILSLKSALHSETPVTWREIINPGVCTQFLFETITCPVFQQLRQADGLFPVGYGVFYYVTKIDDPHGTGADASG